MRWRAARPSSADWIAPIALLTTGASAEPRQSLVRTPAIRRRSRPHIAACRHHDRSRRAALESSRPPWILKTADLEPSLNERLAAGAFAPIVHSEMDDFSRARELL